MESIFEYSFSSFILIFLGIIYMSDINKIILYEYGLLGAGSSLSGRLLANYGLNTLGPSVGLAGDALTNAVPVVNTLYGAGLQAYLNHVRQKNDEINGTKTADGPIMNAIKSGAMGLASSIPFFGALSNIYTGYQIGDEKDKLNKVNNQIAYANAIQRMQGNNPAPSSIPAQ